MRNLFKIIFASFILLPVFNIEAQIAINSPYTRFGLGEISQSGFGLGRALGGTAFGHRFSNQINILNPASYSGQDTMSFILDFGLNGEIRKLSSSFEEVKRNDFNMGHLALAFPVTKWWGASLGVMPYSRIGYNMLIEGTFDQTEDIYRIFYEGNGSLNKFYFGSALRFGKHLSIGGNMSYIFGSYERNRRVSIPREGSAETYYLNRTTIGDIMFTFGMQAFTNLSSNHKLVAGVVIDNEAKLNSEFQYLLVNNYYGGARVDTMDIIDGEKGNIIIPLRLGAGFSYSYKDKLYIAFDYITQNWSNASFFGKTDSLANSSSVRFGLQYIPVAVTEVKRAPYWQRISFRAGGYYNKTYLEFNGDQMKDYGITFGVGIPWKNEKNLLTRQSFNLSYQLGWQGSLENGLVKEKYQVFSIGLTLYDFWFIKRKYD